VSLINTLSALNLDSCFRVSRREEARGYRLTGIANRWAKIDILLAGEEGSEDVNGDIVDGDEEMGEGEGEFAKDREGEIEDRGDVEQESKVS